MEIATTEHNNDNAPKKPRSGPIFFANIINAAMIITLIFTFMNLLSIPDSIADRSGSLISSFTLLMLTVLSTYFSFKYKQGDSMSDFIVFQIALIAFTALIYSLSCLDEEDVSSLFNIELGATYTAENLQKWSSKLDGYSIIINEEMSRNDEKNTYYLIVKPDHVTESYNKAHSEDQGKFIDIKLTTSDDNRINRVTWRGSYYSDFSPDKYQLRSAFGFGVMQIGVADDVLWDGTYGAEMFKEDEIISIFIIEGADISSNDTVKQGKAKINKMFGQ